MRALVLCVVLSVPAAAAGQEIDPRIFAAAAVGAMAIAADDAAHASLTWPVSHRRRADWLSSGVVAGAIALPCLEARTRACVRASAVRIGITVGIAESAKYFIPRERPDRSDRKSFFSEHTALACVGGLASKREALGTALCAAAAYLRVAAEKHWLTDVAVGAGVGLAVSRVAR